MAAGPSRAESHEREIVGGLAPRRILEHSHASLLHIQTKMVAFIHKDALMNIKLRKTQTKTQPSTLSAPAADGVRDVSRALCSHFSVKIHACVIVESLEENTHTSYSSVYYRFETHK